MRLPRPQRPREIHGIGVCDCPDPPAPAPSPISEAAPGTVARQLILSDHVSSAHPPHGPSSDRLGSELTPARSHFVRSLARQRGISLQGNRVNSEGEM